MAKFEEMVPLHRLQSKAESQRTHDVEMTSYRRRCDVITSHRRQSEVILTSCACWDGAFLQIKCENKAHHDKCTKNQAALSI